MKKIELELHPASDPPDDDRDVLCFAPKQTWTGYYTDGSFWDNSGETWGEVTWWAEMPQLLE